MADGAQRRRHFRLRYPVSERPRLVIDDSEFELTELSEGGFRLRVVRGIQDVSPPAEIETDITLVSGQVRPISAVFKRNDGKEFIYIDLEGISLRDLMDEQRYLIRKYPDFGRTVDPS